MSTLLCQRLDDTSGINTNNFVDDVAHNLIDNRPLTTTRGEGDNIKLIKTWLNDRESSHSFCGQRNNTNAELLTRLVEIVDPETIRLVETEGQFGQYVALSYCWGPQAGNNAMNKKANFRARLHPEGLRRNELPAAIRDDHNDHWTSGNTSHLG